MIDDIIENCLIVLMFIIKVVVSIVIFCGILYISVGYWRTVETKQITKKVNIYSLDTKSGVSGAFIMGFGKVQTSPKYYVYDITDKGKILHSYNAEEVYINDGLAPNDQAYVEEVYTQRMYKAGILVSYLASNKNKTQINGKKYLTNEKLDHIVINVPKGYIQQEIDLNVK